MISLRQHINNARTAHAASSLEQFRLMLVAMGESGQRAVPSLSTELNHKLSEIGKELDAHPTNETVRNIRERAETELFRWADSALQHHIENERKIIGVVARLAETVGAKDEKFSREIGALAEKMMKVADMTEISEIRASILDTTSVLKSCVERMAEEGKTSIRRMTAEIEGYRTRLEESEKVASLDPLTQLANRRAFDRKLEQKIQDGLPFSLILIDLNGFKAVNDVHGHLAGDDLLRQFAKELRAQFLPADLVSRWGGDEFAAIVPGKPEEAVERAGRIHSWVLGAYKINTGSGTVKVAVQASIGVEEWDGREDTSSLLARTDQSLYREKERPAVEAVPAYWE